MPSIEKEPIYDMYCISRRQYQRYIYRPGYDERYLMVAIIKIRLVTSAKYYMFRAFPENLELLSSKLMIIWMLETTYVVSQVLNVTSRMALTV